MFADRRRAGERLAERLTARGLGPDVVVLGIPRGGVVVAAEVARVIGASLDVLVVRKVGHPANPEFAAGAVDPEGGLILNPAAHVTEDEISRTAEEERLEARRRVEAYRSERPPLRLDGATAVLVDDGVATGLTALKAVGYARALGAARVVMAAPVMSVDAAEALGEAADDVVAVEVPRVFGAVGQFYASFPQTSDTEVIDILHASAHGG